MSILLVSRGLELASILATGTFLVTDSTSFSKASVDALGSIFGAPGIGVDVTAFGLLCVFFGVPEVFGFGDPLASAARAPGVSHREFDLLLVVVCCRLGSFFSSAVLEVPGFGDPWRFCLWSFPLSPSVFGFCL